MTGGMGLKLDFTGVDMLEKCEFNYAYVDGTGEDLIRGAFGTATSHTFSLSMNF
jgi:hypothetical protein